MFNILSAIILLLDILLSFFLAFVLTAAYFFVSTITYVLTRAQIHVAAGCKVEIEKIRTVKSLLSDRIAFLGGPLTRHSRVETLKTMIRAFRALKPTQLRPAVNTSVPAMAATLRTFPVTSSRSDAVREPTRTDVSSSKAIESEYDTSCPPTPTLTPCASPASESSEFSVPLTPTIRTALPSPYANKKATATAEAEISPLLVGGQQESIAIALVSSSTSSEQPLSLLFHPASGVSLEGLSDTPIVDTLAEEIQAYLFRTAEEDASTAVGPVVQVISIDNSPVLKPTEKDSLGIQPFFTDDEERRERMQAYARVQVTQADPPSTLRPLMLGQKYGLGQPVSRSVGPGPLASSTVLCPSELRPLLLPRMLVM